MSLCCYCDQSSADGSIDSKIQCMGPCGLFVHLSCVKMTKTVKKACEETPELHFYCKKCDRFSNAGVANALDTFSANIVALSEALKPLMAINMNSLVSNFIANNSSNDTLTTKRRRLDNDVNIVTMRSGKESSKVGTKASNELSTVPPRKSLVISHLASSTTPEMIMKYIKDNLDDEIGDEIRCTMLLPAGKQPSDLNFIGFRVSAPDRMFSTLYNGEFWPNGVQLREFTFRPKKQPMITPVFMNMD